MACKKVNPAPSIMVIVKAIIVFFRFPSIREWWAHVTVNPEASNTIVFSSGTSNGSRGVIPLGGHCIPMLWVGLKLRKKKVQKKPKKNNSSEEINRIIPYRRPFCTALVWCP